MSRRSLFAAAAGGSLWLGGIRPSRASSRLEIPAAPTKTEFRIVRKKSVVGYHRVTITPNGDGMTVKTTVRIAVKVAFVTAFTFDHDCSEVWAGDRLRNLEAATNNNGDRLKVSGKAISSGFEVKGPSGPFTAPVDALTTTCMWSPAFLAQSEAIDTQNGGMIGLVSKKLGADKVKLLDATLPTERYDLVTPYVTGELWYSADERWVKATFELQGERIGYDLEA